MRGGTAGLSSRSRDRIGSALSLLVGGVLPDGVALAAAPDDLAVLADPLDAGSNLHRTSCSLSHQQQEPDPTPAPSIVSGRRAVRLTLWPGLPVLGRIRPIYTSDRQFCKWEK